MKIAAICALIVVIVLSIFPVRGIQKRHAQENCVTTTITTATTVPMLSEEGRRALEKYKDYEMDGVTLDMPTSEIRTVLQLNARLAQTGALQAEDLRAFFNEYEKTLLRLANILLSQPAGGNIQEGWFSEGGLFLDAKQKEEFNSFFELAQVETFTSIQISFGSIGRNRFVTFGFDGFDRGSARISYMPDEYIKFEFESELAEAYYCHEFKLAKNWYGYWW